VLAWGSSGQQGQSSDKQLGQHPAMVLVQKREERTSKRSEKAA
jgi:hypothetical protein